MWMPNELYKMQYDSGMFVLTRIFRLSEETAEKAMFIYNVIILLLGLIGILLIFSLLLFL